VFRSDSSTASPSTPLFPILAPAASRISKRYIFHKQDSSFDPTWKSNCTVYPRPSASYSLPQNNVQLSSLLCKFITKFMNK
jgi:hypothetical protein